MSNLVNDAKFWLTQSLLPLASVSLAQQTVVVWFVLLQSALYVQCVSREKGGIH